MISLATPDFDDQAYGADLQTYTVSLNLSPELQLPLQLSSCAYYKHVQSFMSQTILYPNLCLPHIQVNISVHKSQWAFLHRSTGQKLRPHSDSFPNVPICSPAKFSNLPSGNLPSDILSLNSFKFISSPCLPGYYPSRDPLISHPNYQKNSIIGPRSVSVLSHLNAFSIQLQSLK